MLVTVCSVLTNCKFNSRGRVINIIQPLFLLWWGKMKDVVSDEKEIHMKVLVVGASGRVGEELVKQLVADGREVVAGTRHTDQDFGAGVTVKNIDLLADEATLIGELRPLAVDAIYFVAGSRGKNLLQIDAFGAVKLENAAEALGIKRFIMLSSWNATSPAEWGEGLRDYNIAKFFADRWLMDNTKLDYTILQPGSLVEEPATGLVALDLTEPGKNAIPNVAAVLAALLQAENTYRQVITMHDGDVAIPDALRELKSI